MLSTTKLGIEALSKFAKKQNVPCSCIYRGYYHPLGNPYEDAFITTANTIPAKGYWCKFCDRQVIFKIYGWSWQSGIKQASFSSKAALADIVKNLLNDMQELSHIAIMEVHTDINNLWVYRYDKSRL